MEAVKSFMQEEEGAVAIEYALLAALIAIIIAVGAFALGNRLCAFFQAIATGLGNPSTIAPLTSVDPTCAGG